jgi:tRNA nucleotidyltransferase/poly(A) polymerase
MPLALLLHDSGKPLTRTETDEPRIRFFEHERVGAEIARQVVHRLHLSNEAIQFVVGVVAGHMRPLLLATEPSLSRRAIYRFFRDTAPAGEAGVAVALHALVYQCAQNTGSAPTEALQQTVNRLVAAYFTERNQVIEPPPLLSGRDMIEELGLPPGKLIGLLLRRLKEAQAVGEVQDRAAALAFVKSDPDFAGYQSGHV